MVDQVGEEDMGYAIAWSHLEVVNGSFRQILKDLAGWVIKAMR